MSGTVGGKPIVLRYDVSRYPFRKIMESHLRVEPLESVHAYYGMPTITSANDQETNLHRAMYSIGEEFLSVYRAFVRDWVQLIIEDSVIFQKMPSFRHQPPGTVAVGKSHRDSDFGHSASEINIWVPLTQSEPSSSLWIESSPGMKDFAPVVVPFGCAMVFDAVSLEHGNKVNTSKNTRVSFECRVIKESCYEARAERSVKQHKLFQVGDYFDRLE
jgi:ectoine hydroxylase-related dioxygenase (phytanoyl-CoA dioxygenase family)